MKNWIYTTLVAACPVIPALAQDAALLKKAHKIHEKAFTLDTHADTPMLLSRGGFDVTKDNSARGSSATGVMMGSSKVDYPRMCKGGLDGIFWAVYLGQGPRTPEGHALAQKRAISIFNAIDSTLKATTSEAELATTPEDAYRIGKTGKRVIFIGVENGYTMGHDISMLKNFYDRGARYMTLCHSSNNDICDSSTDPKGAEYQGLSSLGEGVVAEMNRLGMMVDVSHVSDSTFYDVIRLSKVPIIASHSGARAICNHPRNITDDMLRALAKNGGVIQLNLLSDYVKTIPPSQEREAALQAMLTKWGLKDRRAMMGLPEEDQKRARAEFMALNQKYPVQLATVKDAVDHIDHMVKIAGIDHVGMGADFDGGGALADCFDVSQYENVTIELVRRGYSKRDIEKIWGGNFFRVMKEVDKGAVKVVAAN